MNYREIMDALNGNARRRARYRIAIGTSIGVLVGAGVAILLAPKSGKDTRADIKHGAEWGVDKAKEVTNKAVSFVKKEADMVSDAVTDKVDDIITPLKKGKEAMEESAEKIKEENKS